MNHHDPSGVRSFLPYCTSVPLFVFTDQLCGDVFISVTIISSNSFLALWFYFPLPKTFFKGKCPTLLCNSFLFVCFVFVF